MLPAALAGDPWQAAPGVGLLAGAMAAGFTARRVRRSPALPAQPAPDLRLLGTAANALSEGLITVRGFSELLARGEGSDSSSPRARSASRFILDNSEDLTRFVANLQDFVRCEEGRIRLIEQQVDAAELVEAALSLCRGAAERADVVLVALLLEGVELRCDPGRIRNAIADMVLWVTDAAPVGSVVRVRLLHLEAKSVAIRVTSTAGNQPVSFEPREGLRGFALPVARRMALLHSGDLTIDSGSGAGTTACLILPPHRVIRSAPAGACESRAA
jgi:signal transduction histidine kinase